MTYTVGCRISIGKYTFLRCNEVVIEKSTALVQDTARIKLPLTAVLPVKNVPVTTIELAKTLKIGDKVNITLAYNEAYNKTEFVGYVKRINPGMPLEIECEDAIWLLRRKNIKKSWAQVTLRQVLEEIVSGTGIELSGDIPEMILKPYGLKDIDGAFALQKIADEYGLKVYLKPDGKLWAGLSYTENSGKVNYCINGEESNVITANELKWRSKDDVKIKVKGVNIRKDNTRTEVELGDENGSLRTLFFYNVQSKKELENLAKQELNKLKFDGYEGKITTFLIPEALPGMTANLTDEIFTDRSGSYYIESVKTTFGTSGARREVELGIKL